jgi:hypothetical protein
MRWIACGDLSPPGGPTSCDKVSPDKALAPDKAAGKNSLSVETAAASEILRFERTLADFDLAAVFPEHILHEADDISRHGTLLLHPSHSELTLGHQPDPGLREIKRLIAG